MTDSKGNGVLSPAQRALLVDALDHIVPPAGDRPGAGEAGAADYIDGVLERSPELRHAFLSGLAALDAGPSPFESLGADEKVSRMRGVETSHLSFFTTLVREGYAGYYSNPAVVEVLGLDPTPPQPVGYVLEPFDYRLLDNPKNLGKLYKDARP